MPYILSVEEGFYSINCLGQGSDLVFSGTYKDQHIASFSTGRREALIFAEQLRDHALAERGELFRFAPLGLARICADGQVTPGLLFFTTFGEKEEDSLFHFQLFGPRGGILRRINIQQAKSLIALSEEIERAALLGAGNS